MKSIIHPCPLCGAEAEFVVNTWGFDTDEKSFFKYRCPACHAGVGSWDSNEDAAMEWNKWANSVSGGAK